MRPRDHGLGRAEFATNLRARRLAAKLTQEELGDRADVHPTEISRLERRRREPRLSMIVRLGRALDIPPAELLDRIR
ncbi:MAG: helix-turn-helix domain-containing protein [Thermoleophilaceae bacterium]